MPMAANCSAAHVSMAQKVSVEEMFVCLEGHEESLPELAHFAASGFRRGTG